MGRADQTVYVNAYAPPGSIVLSWDFLIPRVSPVATFGRAPSGPEPFLASVTATYISRHTDWLPGQFGNEIVNSNHFFESECV